MKYGRAYYQGSEEIEYFVVSLTHTGNSASTSPKVPGRANVKEKRGLNQNKEGKIREMGGGRGQVLGNGRIEVGGDD